jgi:hypothetical protein
MDGFPDLNNVFYWSLFLAAGALVLASLLGTLACWPRGPRVRFWRGAVLVTAAAYVGAWFLAAPAWNTIHKLTGIYHLWSRDQALENSFAAAGGFAVLNCLSFLTLYLREEERLEPREGRGDRDGRCEAA